MARIYVYGIVCSICFAGGWTVHGWKVDSENSAAVVAVREVQSSISAELEDKLSKLKENERLILREIPKYIDRPVYLNECIDADGLRDINASKG